MLELWFAGLGLDDDKYNQEHTYIYIYYICLFVAHTLVSQFHIWREVWGSETFFHIYIYITI